MSEYQIASELDAALTSRFVSALDALPVPPGAVRLSPSHTQRARRWSAAVAALVLCIAVGVTVPPVREAIAGAAKWLEQLIVGPAWVGYYIDQVPLGPGGLPTSRVMVTTGRLPGTPTVPEVIHDSTDHGPWSPLGDRIIINAGGRLYVGDRAGSVRRVADLGLADPWLPRWIGSDKIIVAAQENGALWAIRVDLTSGEVDRQRLSTGLNPQPPAAFSPDGRWLVLARAEPGGCIGNNSVLYDLASDGIVPLTDVRGRALFAVGWLSDARLVSAFCDPSGGQIEYFVGSPDSGPTVPFAVLPWAPRTAPPLMDRSSDRVLVSTQRGATPGVVSLLTLDGRLTDVVRLPTLTTDDLNGEVNHGTLSRDGRYLSLRIGETGTDKRMRYRAAVIDVRTGQVTYACDTDCARLSLR